MHLAASISNFTWLEYPYDPLKITPDVFQGIVARYYLPESDGCIPMPDAPGFGIELDKEKIAKYRIA
jgi:L-alanine-DL-glutamate epimerase-like enolase superfamily enzyme